MINLMKTVQLAHGSGGKLSGELLEFIAELLGPCLVPPVEDSGGCFLPQSAYAVTTDSFTITPPFFPGGDIGRLAVCGTINDLVMVGARPLYLTLALVLEEGFLLADLAKILTSIREEILANKVMIIAGDTKVGGRGDLDRVFINTTGLGVKTAGREIGAARAVPGDRVLVTGPVGDHGGTVMALRNDFAAPGLVSDCRSLTKLVDFAAAFDIHVMRDPTRGGLASVLNEIARASGVEILLREEAVPVRENVRGICEILGLDPFYLACEGRAVIICPAAESRRLLAELQKEEDFTGSCEIGEVTCCVREPRLLLETVIGARRILPLMTGEPAPRIC